MPINDELRNLVIKILVPALVGISIKLAVQSKKAKVSVSTIIGSIVIGVGSAWLASGWVFKTFSEETTSIVIAVIAIAGEKVAEWLIYKFNFDVIGDAIVNEFWSGIKRAFNRKTD